MIIMNGGPEELTVAIPESHTTERGGSGESMTDTMTGRGTDTGTMIESPGTGDLMIEMTGEAMRGSRDQERSTTD